MYLGRLRNLLAPRVYTLFYITGYVPRKVKEPVGPPCVHTTSGMLYRTDDGTGKELRSPDYRQTSSYAG